MILLYHKYIIWPLPKQKCFFLLSDPFHKLLMPKVERVYNLRIDIVMKQKELY